MITLNNVDKVYRTERVETLALHNINLDIAAGELVSIMGPSGCGKSTLLNLMGLLDKPTAGAVLERVGLQGNVQDRRPAELSGGEQQRVAIARALVTTPELLLADEPTGNLDSATGTAILALLHDLNRERQLTVVLVTHGEVAAQSADRIVTLRDGCIARVTDGPADAGERVEDHAPRGSRRAP